MAQFVKVAVVMACLLAATMAEPPAPLSSQYGPPSGVSGASGEYVAPAGISEQYGAPSGPSEVSGQYGVPTGPSGVFGQYGAPSAGVTGEYGVPERLAGLENQRRLYSSGNGAGRFSYARDGDEKSEPANYEFQYDVEAGDYEVKFGHQEARQGDVAQGRYYVLLPDGRTQVVEYVADQNGYQPRISYVGGENGYGSQRGYPDGKGGGYDSSNGHGGYSSVASDNHGYSSESHNSQSGYSTTGASNLISQDQGGYNR